MSDNINGSDVGRLSLDGKSASVITDKQKLALSYLRALDSRAYEQVMVSMGLSGSCDIPAFTAWDADQCIMCLQTFIDVGIWPGYLFSKGDVWLLYLLSLTEERYYTSLTLLCAHGSPADMLVFLRVAYKFGQQVIPDQEYDGLEKLYLSTYSNIRYLNNATPDDMVGYITPIVSDAIRLSNIRGSRKESPKPVSSTGSYASLNSEKSTSIMPMRSVEEVYQWLKQAPHVDTHWSLKADGINVKMLFKPDGQGLDVAISRGRAADSWDYTDAVKRVIHAQSVDVSALSGRITGEGIVDVSALEKFRLKYPGKNYKSPKSTASAMLRAPQLFDLDDYKYLHICVFEMEGVLKDQAFDRLKASGFLPPPEVRVPFDGIPLSSIGEFEDWLTKSIFSPLWDAGKEREIGSDGVVLQLLTDVEGDRADKYSDLNIALKFGPWTEAEYTSTVKAILFEQRRVEMSVVLEIEPVTTRDLNVATRVSVGSSAILVYDNVRVGDKIRFARKSEAINIYLGKA